MKKIEDYLHLYIGCEVLAPTKYYHNEGDGLTKGLFTGIHGELGAEIQFIINGYAEEEPSYVELRKVKPILRRLSSMTEDEAVELYDFLYPSSTAERKIKRFAITNHLDDKGVYWEGKIAIFDYIDWFPWLLKKGFDLFGLIDEGLAIDAQTL